MANDSNPYNKWIHLAKTVDSWRIFPRAFIVVYLIILYEVTIWFMELTDPNNAQAAFVSVVISAGAGWFGLYVNTGGNKTSE